MAWFGPGPCNCQCCRCTPAGDADCSNRCDNNTTGVENIYVTLENWPAGTFVYYTRVAANILDPASKPGIIRVEVSGNETMNRSKQLIWSRIPNTYDPYTGIYCVECNAIPFNFGDFVNPIYCCYKAHPFDGVQYKIKWEMKFYNTVNTAIDPCLEWDNAHVDYFATNKFYTFTWDPNDCVLFDPWVLQQSRICPNFGTSLNATVAQFQCNNDFGVTLFLQPNLAFHANNFGLAAKYFCGPLNKEPVGIGPHAECNQLPQSYIGYIQYHVDKKRSENPYKVPVAYEIIISDLPNKYYFYDNESGPEAVEITGLDQFNGTYNIETESNGCVNTPYIEEIAVDVAAFQISRWQLPSGNCTNTPFPNPFPATGTAVLRIPPVPRKPIFGSSFLVYDWIVISIQNPFTGVGLLQRNISTSQGLSCKETDTQLGPGTTCLPLPNPYFRIRIKPIY